MFNCQSSNVNPAIYHLPVIPDPDNGIRGQAPAGIQLSSGFSHLSCRKGYTLMEVMLVVFLIVLILGIATVFLANSLPAAGLRATGREMAATIKYAKHLAKANNEKQMVNIDLDSKTYAVEGRETKKIPSDIIVTILDTNLDAISKGRFSIVFDATGGNDWHSIILSRGGSKTTIAMDPIMTAVIADGKK